MVVLMWCRYSAEFYNIDSNVLFATNTFLYGYDVDILMGGISNDDVTIMHTLASVSKVHIVDNERKLITLIEATGTGRKY